MILKRRKGIQKKKHQKLKAVPPDLISNRTSTKGNREQEGKERNLQTNNVRKLPIISMHFQIKRDSECPEK